MKHWLLLSVAGLSLSGALSFAIADDQKKSEGEKPVVTPREKEGAKSEREGEKERPKEGEKKVFEKGEKPREGDKERPREGDVKKAERREADQPKKPHPEAEHAKRPNPEAEKIKQRLGELHGQLKKHAEAGRDEDVARLKREIEELHRALAPRGGEREREPGQRGEHVEIAVKHLFEAAEHLRAAGMPDIAEHIGRQGKEILQHHGRRPHEKDERPRGPEAGRPGALEEQLHDLGQAIRKLNERLEKLEHSRK